ncbi:Cysteine-rich secretory protein family protein [Nocardioides sp. J9]|uniref:CAP domain-containing protein n=1 Tax=unclassified Nocardioides TaxID=2615069 RepID=UPI0004B67C7A|nr:MULTISPECIES: CAP domain-containing protein [unclassified Nocardioides]TWG92625.1 Cysteine-rich secretory protein family protein [Nocardioides sp. J9]
MTRFLRSAAVGLMASAALVAAPDAAPPAAEARTVVAKSNTYERNVMRHINKRRANNGMRGVKASACVDRYAESRARRMANENRMVHYPGLRRVFTGCGGRLVGEIIARGRGFNKAAVVVRAWMHSRSHRDVILTRKFRQAGVGAWRDGSGTVFVSVVFRAP